MLHRIGADHFLDDTKTNFSISGQTYDVIFDMVAQKSFRDCIKALKPKGRYLMSNPRILDMVNAVLRCLQKRKSCLPLSEERWRSFWCFRR